MPKYLLVIFAALITTTVAAQDDSVSTLIQNARIFDGVSEALIEGQDVLITDDKFAQIASDYLMRGITSVRGAAGNSYSLKAAIDIVTEVCS